MWESKCDTKIVLKSEQRLQKGNVCIIKCGPMQVFNNWNILSALINFPSSDTPTSLTTNGLSHCHHHHHHRILIVLSYLLSASAFVLEKQRNIEKKKNFIGESGRQGLKKVCIEKSQQIRFVNKNDKGGPWME